MERKYSPEVYESVCEIHNWGNDEISKILIDYMSLQEVLTDYLQWQGILGYSGKIMDIINANQREEQ